AVAECRQQWFVPALKDVPGRPIGFTRRVIGSDRYEQRKLLRSGFVTIVGKGRIVGGDHLRRQLSLAGALHDPANVELGSTLRILPPAEKRFAGLRAPGWQTGVGDHNAREAVRIFGKNTQADQPAPVLANEGDIAEVQAPDKSRHPIDVTL